MKTCCLRQLDGFVRSEVATVTDLKEPFCKSVTLWSAIQAHVLNEVKDMDMVPLSNFDCANGSIRSTKVFLVFRLFLDDIILAQGQTMIMSSRNNLKFFSLLQIINSGI